MKLTKSRMRRDERTFEVRLEGRAGDNDDPLRIVGHPVVYGVWSQDLGGFRERVMTGAARKTLKEADIRGLFNHDPNFVLGRNVAGTMELAEDDRGVAMRLFPPETDIVDELVIQPMQRGDITQMSFAFRTIKDEWRQPGDADIVVDDGLWERDLIEFEMWDASIVTFPAYTQTDAAVRSALEAIGLDADTLVPVLNRAGRGAIATCDRAILDASIDTIRNLVPQEPEPSAATPDEPRAGRSIAHLRRLLDVHEREIALT